MNNKKNIFISFLLFSFLWVLSTSCQNFSVSDINSISSTFITKNKKTIRDIHKTPITNKKSANIIDETESEIEIEIHLFYDKLDFHYVPFYFSSKITSNFPLLLFYSKLKVPLYDLFCNWKIMIF